MSLCERTARRQQHPTHRQEQTTEMFVKLAIFASCMAVGLAAWHGPLAGGAPADKYPAGVSPQACPNYPHCDNPAVAVNPSAPAHGAWNHGGWNGGAGAGHAGGAWNGGHAGGWNGGWNGGEHGGAWGQNALDNGEYTGDGDYRGEGLAESGAYGDISHNYNSENNGAWNGGGHAGGWNGGHAGGWNGGAAPAWNAGHAGHAAQVPAGVDPHACPNYPFCS